MGSLLPFIVSLLLGFLIGIERERNRAPDSAMGVRTFTLLAILGSLAGWLSEAWIASLLATFALSLVLLAYYRETRPRRNVDRGLTTEIAAGLVFTLSFASHRNPPLIALLACIVTLLLFWKKPLHRFSRHLQPRELEAALLLLLLGIGVLSLLEDKVIDPFGLFNPRKFGLIVLAVGGIEFVSYLAVKFFDPAKSPLFVGFFAGLVSSTALTLTSAHLNAKKPAAWRQHAAMVISGKIASIVELLAIVGFSSPALAPQVATLVAPPVAAGAAAVFWLLRSGPREGSSLQINTPLDIPGVLRLSLLLAVILAVVALAQRYAGDLGRDLVVAIGATFELHGVSLATATLHEKEQLSMAGAVRSLQVAMAADLLAKIALPWFVVRNSFSRAVTVTFAMMIALVLSTGFFLG